MLLCPTACLRADPDHNKLEFDGSDTRSPLKDTSSWITITSNATQQELIDIFGNDTIMVMSVGDKPPFRVKPDPFVGQYTTNDILDILTEKEIEYDLPKIHKDPSLTLFCPPPSNSEDSKDASYAVAVAHELLHMKHFLEERIALYKLANTLLDKAHQDTTLKTELSTFAGGSVTCEQIIFKCREPQGLCDLCNLAKKHNIVNNSLLPQPFIEKSPRQSARSDSNSNDDLSFQDTYHSLEFFPYSMSKKTNIMTPSNFLSATQSFSQEHENLYSGIDINSFSDLEDLRTVAGPDQDEITENVIRVELGLVQRLKYDIQP